MYTGLLHITLFVRDVVRSVDFYQRVLGFNFEGYWDPTTRLVVDVWERASQPEYAEFIAGTSRVGLRPAGERRPGTTAEYDVETVDLDLLHRRVKENGGRPTAPRVQPSGHRSFRVTDPDGHTWHLVESAAVRLPRSGTSQRFSAL